MSEQQSQLPDALAKLQELRQAGVLTEEEFTRAKERLLQAPSPDALTVAEADAMLERVDRAERRAALAELRAEQTRLDQSWQERRKSYLIAGKNGQAITPTRGGAIATGVTLFIVGLFTTLLGGMSGSGKSGSEGPLALVGLVGFCLMIAAIAEGNRQWQKAVELEQAESAHAQSRERLSEKIREAERRK